MSTIAGSRTATAVSTEQKVGLVLCMLSSLASLPSFLMAAEPRETGHRWAAASSSTR